MKNLIFILFLIACGGGSSKNSETPSLDNACNFRVIGGTSCSQEDLPTVLLEIESEDSLEICTGTIVKNDYIITAAHCLTDALVVDVYSDKGTATATQIIPHPNFNEVNANNDVGLIKVPGFTKSVNISPVEIGYTEDVKINDYLTFIGYGQNENGDVGFGLPGSNPIATILKVEYLSSGVIGNKYDSTKTNACFGDSGGSLYKSGKIVGIESYGTKECKEGDENFFADLRLDSNKSFLDKYLN